MRCRIPNRIIECRATAILSILFRIPHTDVNFGTAQGAPVVAVADADGQQVMIRDPRLDELLAAHKQFGSTSALQMPAGFLRNATFETPGR